MNAHDRQALIGAYCATLRVLRGIEHAEKELEKLCGEARLIHTCLVRFIAPDADLDLPGTSRPDVLAAGLAVPADDDLVQLDASVELDGPEGWRQRHYARKGGSDDATPL